MTHPATCQACQRVSTGDTAASIAGANGECAGRVDDGAVESPYLLVDEKKVVKRMRQMARDEIGSADL